MCLIEKEVLTWLFLCQAVSNETLSLLLVLLCCIYLILKNSVVFCDLLSCSLCPMCFELVGWFVFLSVPKLYSQRMYFSYSDDSVEHQQSGLFVQNEQQ